MTTTNLRVYCLSFCAHVLSRDSVRYVPVLLNHKIKQPISLPLNDIKPCVYACVRVCVSACVRASVRVRVYMCVRMYARVFMCMCVCACVRACVLHEMHARLCQLQTAYISYLLNKIETCPVVFDVSSTSRIAYVTITISSEDSANPCLFQRCASDMNYLAYVTGA